MNLRQIPKQKSQIKKLKIFNGKGKKNKQNSKVVADVFLKLKSPNYCRFQKFKGEIEGNLSWQLNYKC